MECKIMRRALFAAVLLGAACAGGPLMAAEPGEGKSAGDLMVRLRAIGVFPQASDSSVSVIGGHVDASDTAEPEGDFTYFFTDNIAAELIAAVTRHSVAAKGTALGDVAVGKVSLLPPTLTAQYHFMPKSRFSPYLGAGINYTWFYDSSPAGGTVTSVRYDDNFGAVIQAGLDYNVTDRWYLNLDVKQIFLSTTASLNGGAIKAKVDLNPTIVGAGIGYRF
jgi:outer membrane protein